MKLLYILGLSVKQYADLLVYGGIAAFIIIGLPIVYAICKAFDKVNESDFNPIDYIYGRPQIRIPDKSVRIEIKITKSEPRDVQSEPDAPEQSEEERPQP